MLQEHVQTADVAQVFRMLATLVEHGFTLDEALELLQTERFRCARLNAVIDDLRRKVATGVPLSEALRAHPRLFSPMCVELVEMQELAGGRLGVTLSRVAELMGGGLARQRDEVVSPGATLLAMVVVGALGWYAGRTFAGVLPTGGEIERGVIIATGVALACGVAVMMALVLLSEAWGRRRADSRHASPVVVPDGQEAVERFIASSLLMRLLEEGGGDLHLEPAAQGGVLVRRRGRVGLETLFWLSRPSAEAVTTHLKRMARLAQANRLPGEGVMQVLIDGERCGFGLATAPTLRGERMTLRHLGAPGRPRMLEELGMSPALMEAVRDLIHEPKGGLLVVGPPGSGRTTTLYALLAQLNHRDLNIITVEDRVKRSLPGVSQMAVDVEVGLTRSAALLATSWHDPDVLMVDEVGADVLPLTLYCALASGPLVLGSRAGSDVEGTLIELMEQDALDPCVVQSGVKAVLAQRVVRRLCPACRAPYQPGEVELDALGVSRLDLAKAGGVFHRAVGCERCFRRGYVGLVGLFELLPLSEGFAAQDERGRAVQEAWRAVARGEGPEALREALAGSGFKTLREDGARKVLEGLTTVEEVLRATPAKNIVTSCRGCHQRSEGVGEANRDTRGDGHEEDHEDDPRRQPNQPSSQGFEGAHRGASGWRLGQRGR